MAASQYTWYGQVNAGTEAVPDWYHLPQGILKNFGASVNSTSKSGNGTFRITDKANDLWDVLDALDNDGVSQEFRLYFGDKNISDFVFGGYINKIRRPKRNLVLEVDHYMGLLTREMSVDDKYQDKTGSYMVSDITGTNGLVPKYFPISTTGVVPISVANHVNLTASQTGKEFEYNANAQSIMTAVKQIASKTRLTGGVVPFDFYVNYDVTNDEKALWFDVKNAATYASGVTLYEGADFFDSFKLEEDISRLINHWTVRGEDKLPCPIDKDYWTEQGAPSTFWSTANSAVSSSANEKVGAASVRCDCDDTNTQCGIRLDLDDAQAFNATATPAELFSSTNGFILDDEKEQWFSCYIQVDDSLAAELGSGDAKFLRVALANETPVYIVNRAIFVNDDYRAALGTSGMFGEPTADVWYKIELPLRDLIDTESTYIENVTFDVFYDSGSGAADDFYVDGIHFYEANTPVTSDPADATYPGTDSTSIAAYGRRKDVFNDRSITPIWAAGIMTDGNTQQMCNQIANRLVGYTATPTQTFTAQLKGYRQIYPMYTFTLNVPSRGLAMASYRANQITYSPAGQTVMAKPASFYDDSGYDIGILVAQLNANLREAGRR